ncbi:MAG: ABC transporter substrate-binding protein [Bacteroidetes bacterium]|nr:ABC transporter substrate-binding protein [Bacteroidota bacterium]
MKKIILPFVALALIYSCGQEVNTEGGLQKLNGGKYSGGVLRLNIVEDFRNLYPLDITEESSKFIASQMYEGLVKLSQIDLSVIPALAESWKSNEDATVWTFHIRKGAKFHKDECFGGKGREVTAKDFKWCFDNLCTGSPHNQWYSTTFKDRVKGANEYYQSTKDKKSLAGGVSGVKVIDDYTLEITLNNSFAGFLNILVVPGCYLFPKEALEKYGEDGMRIKTVGTGPFILKTVKEGETVIMEKNPDYWAKDADGNQLPYLDAVRYSFIKEKKQEFLEFKKGNLDMVYRIPTENIGDILSDLKKAKENTFLIQVTPAMSVFYYGFLHPKAPFNDKRVRLAFNHAIDRQKIVDYTLKGDGIPAFYGIVPPAASFKTKGYNFKALKGYTYDPDLAKKLFSEAGFPNGKNFPHLTLQINSGGGDRNVLTAQVIQSMLKENLNIDVNIETLPFTQHLDKIEGGQTLLWRTGWTSDYPDPESFLTLLYGENIPENLSDRSFINSVRYKSAKFDSLFSLAMKEVDDKKRYDLYTQADQVAIDEGAIMPIFYDEVYRLIQKNVKQFDVNAMEYRDLTSVYFVPEEEKDKK